MKMELVYDLCFGTYQRTWQDNWLEIVILNVTRVAVLHHVWLYRHPGFQFLMLLEKRWSKRNGSVFACCFISLFCTPLLYLHEETLLRQHQSLKINNTSHAFFLLYVVYMYQNLWLNATFEIYRLFYNFWPRKLRSRLLQSAHRNSSNFLSCIISKNKLWDQLDHSETNFRVSNNGRTFLAKVYASSTKYSENDKNYFLEFDAF